MRAAGVSTPTNVPRTAFIEWCCCPTHLVLECVVSLARPDQPSCVIVAMCNFPQVLLCSGQTGRLEDIQAGYMQGCTKSSPQRFAEKKKENAPQKKNRKKGQSQGLLVWQEQFGSLCVSDGCAHHRSQGAHGWL